jgi:hypothetical protein
MTTNRFDITIAKDFLEVGGKLALGVLALCYALGLLVINLYYSRYGVYSLSLFRLNYVIAGVWVVTPVLVMFLALLGLFTIAFFAKPTRRLIMKLTNLTSNGDAGSEPSLPTATAKRRFWTPEEKRRAGFFAVTVFCLAGTMFIWLKLPIALTRMQWGNLIAGAFVVNVAIFAVLYYSLKRQSPIHRLTLYGLLIFLLVAAGMHTFSFALDTYGSIPPHLGGGGTKEVQLLLKADEAEKMYFRTSGLHFYRDLNQTETARLLFETDNELILLVRSNTPNRVNTLSIQRDIVISVLYTGLREPPSFGTAISWDDEPSDSPLPSVTPSPQTSQSPRGTPPNPVSPD